MIRASDKRRVLYVQRAAGGGSMTGLMEILRSLDSKRFEATVLCYEPSHFLERLRKMGVRTLLFDEAVPTSCQAREPTGWHSAIERIPLFGRVSYWMRNAWPFVRELARLYEREGFDIIHQNNNIWADRDSILAARIAGVPQVSHVRFLRSDMTVGDRFVARWPDHYLYVSKAIEHEFLRRSSTSEDRGSVLYDTVDFSEFSPSTDAARRVRDDLGLSPDDMVVSNVGRLVAWKGQRFFVEAMAQIVASFPRATGLLVGRMPTDAKGREYVRSLKSAAEEVGILDRLIFTGFREDVADVMSASDVLVHSSCKPEPFGRVVVEAMAVGCPVVATAAGGVPEIVDDGRTGRLVPPGDAGLMAGAIEDYLGDPAQARRTGQRAAEAVRQRFTRERFARQLQDTYERVLAAS